MCLSLCLSVSYLRFTPLFSLPPHQTGNSNGRDPFELVVELIVQDEQKSGQFMGATIVSTGEHIMVDDHYPAIAFIMYALLVALVL